MKEGLALTVKLFADTADKVALFELNQHPLVKGFTTNPSLLAQAGVQDYKAFAQEILSSIDDKPLSFEVIADTLPEMERQALEIASWGDNVYVKIPVTNSEGEPSYDLIARLAAANVKLNVTAIMTLAQVRDASQAIGPDASAIISVYAGKIADTGRDPVPMMAAAVALLEPYSNQELLWASTRELLNVYQAESIGCDIITVTPAIIKKLVHVGKDLNDYSLEAIKAFCSDAAKAGITL